MNISRKSSTELKIELCRHIASLDGQYYVNVKSGELLTVINDDVEKIQNMFGKTIPTFCADIFTSIPIMTFTFYVEKNFLYLLLLYL